MKKILIPLTIMLMMTTSGCTQKKDYLVTIKTDLGDMIAILYDKTPKHKENFIKLAEEGYYDSLLFHRVINGFMIQGGDPASKKAKPGEPLGQGGPGYTVEAEMSSDLFHEKGALCAARMDDAQNPSKASNGSQFYIVHGTVISEEDTLQLKVDQKKLKDALNQFLQTEANKSIADSLRQLYMAGDQGAYVQAIEALIPQMEKETGILITRDVSKEKIIAYTTRGGVPHLDNEYTVFGKVIQGLDVIDKIAAVGTEAGNRPTEDVRFSVSVDELSRKKISKQYGYEYPQE